MQRKVIMMCKNCGQGLMKEITSVDALHKDKDTTNNTEQGRLEDNPHINPLFLDTDKCRGCSFKKSKQGCPVEKQGINEVIRKENRAKTTK